MFNIKKAAKAFIEATKSGNISEMAEKDVEFHNHIFSATGNKRLRYDHLCTRDTEDNYRQVPVRAVFKHSLVLLQDLTL